MSDPESLAPVPPNPFVGPVPFVEGQVLYGRRRETQALADMLTGKRVVLLISPSGAGKTSLIQAALLPRLRARLDPLPIVRLGRSPEARIVRGNPNRYVLSTLLSLESAMPEDGRMPVEELSRLSLPAYFRVRASRLQGEPARPFKLLVLDQFEELFTLERFDWADKETFLVQLGEALGGSAADTNGGSGDDDTDELPFLWALFSMREDYVAELEPFLHRIPTGFAFRYRLEPLDREQAIEAVTAPAGDFFPRGAAELLVDDLRRLAVAPAGGEDRRLGRFLEPVQLQVVCLRLWDQVVAAQGRPIEVGDISSAGPGNAVDQALGAYYDRLMDEAADAAGVRQHELREWIETKTISRSRMRTRTLRERGPLDNALDVLVGRHLLRIDVAGESEWLELSHDRLVDPILDSNKEWWERNLALFQRQSKLWARSGYPDEMLFSGDKLAEAIAFADANPDNLSNDDQLFIKKSRKLRDRAEAELIWTREIAIKNHRLLAQRRVLSVLGIVIFAAFCLTLVMYLKLENGRLYGQLKQTIASALDGAEPETYQKLISIAETIEGQQNAKLSRVITRHDLKLELQLDLIRVLSNRAPIDCRLGAHDHDVRALRFSNDGTHLFSASLDKHVKHWSMSKPCGGVPEQANHDAAINSLAYSQASQRLVAAGEAGSIKLWGVQDGSLDELADLKMDQNSTLYAAAISPDGVQLATAGEDKKITIWDLNHPMKPRELGSISTEFHRAAIYRLAFIEQGHYKNALVSADWSGRIGIWRPPLIAPGTRGPDITLSARHTQGEAAQIFGLAVSPDGRWIAVGDNRGGVRAWDLETDGKPVDKKERSFDCFWTHLETDGGNKDKRGSFDCFRPHRTAVRDMEFGADSSTLVTVGLDEVLLKWTLPSHAKTAEDFKKELRVERFEGWGEQLHSVAFRAGWSDQVAVGGTNSVWHADLSRTNPLSSRIEVSESPDAVFSAIGATTKPLRLIALEPLKPGARIHRWEWDGDGYSPRLPAIETHETLDRIALALDGMTVAALSCAGKLLMYSLENDPPTTPLVIEEGLAKDVDVLPERQDCVVAFAPDGQSLATGVGESIRLWSRTKTGDWQSTEPEKVTGTPLALAFSPDGRWLASSGRFHGPRVWKVENGMLEATQKEVKAIGPYLPALAFMPDDGRKDQRDQLLISGGEDRVLTAWTLPDPKNASEAKRHHGHVKAMVATRIEGSPLIVSGDDKGQLVVCRWRNDANADALECKRLGRPSGRAIRGLAAVTEPQADGAAVADLQRLIVADEAGLWLWDLDLKSMLDALERLSP
jgi:WD40 repeat protein